MTHELDVEQLADDLLRARDEGEVVSPPSRHDPSFDLECGYRVGHRLHGHLVARGYRPVGRKIGLTNPVTWREFTGADAVADFGVHAALVLGNPWPVGSEDLRQTASVLETLRVTLRGGQNFVAEGEGRNALGNPLMALGHLARELWNVTPSTARRLGSERDCGR
jgi:2-keto-4-pentenoate hydratase